MAIVKRGVAQRRQDPRKRALVAHGDSSFAVMSEPPVLDGAVQFSGTDIADPVNQAGRSAPPNARLSALMMLSSDRIAFVKPFCELFINFFSNPFGPLFSWVRR